MRPLEEGELPKDLGDCHLLEAPPGREKQVAPLIIIQRGPFKFSAWHVTPEEIRDLAAGKPLWLGVSNTPEGFDCHPIVTLGTAHPDDVLEDWRKSQ